ASAARRCRRVRGCRRAAGSPAMAPCRDAGWRFPWPGLYGPATAPGPCPARHVRPGPWPSPRRACLPPGVPFRGSRARIRNAPDPPMKRLLPMACLLAACATAMPVARAATKPLFADRHTADPAPLVVGDTLYLYVGHDMARGEEMFNIVEWRVYSTTD